MTPAPNAEPAPSAETEESAESTKSTDATDSTDATNPAGTAESTEATEATESTAPREPTAPTASPEKIQRIRRRLERLIGIAMTTGNSLVPLRNGDEIFAGMLESIRGAEHTVDMMTFVYWRGDIANEFAQALSERARAGVRVRLLLDGFGSRLIEKDQLEEMERAGVHVAWFRKPLYLSPLKQNHRCHRKVLVVDEQTAFTGGVGIAEEWCGDARNEHEWRDTHVRVRGAAVDGIAAAFTQNWAECHTEMFDDRDRFVEQDAHGEAIVQVVRGSASFGWQDMQTLIRVMLESAEERVRLATAYFAPDAYFVELLCATARRGVSVEILLPGPHTDKRVCLLAGQRYYEDLTACGVKIYQYQPTMMHAKVITVDSIASLIGSTNFNRRSLDHDEEVMLAVLDESLTAELDRHFEEDLTVSEPICPRRWKRRSLAQRVREASVVPIRRYL
ncbi:phospholipase D-like domain-containing protein [Streptomyces sp. NBC_01498]|uniref:phospholipase D-like domain-containing protein n=1 Tax=Streptomyces sp. NBC_01498 TaxID=2975870 RepID=UPI002E7BB814|nr:phospholipase D-like domain-containing protein [Streptomyces sp. NBC_01498]WTL26328.1 phospholipase D-like domain-containing protein [Streptomyces sp. NBC_01498]